jgi:hypothetical protein
MPVVLRGTPSGFDWGFYSSEDPRMHIQTVNPDRDGDYKVWLERDGRRVFEPDEAMPAKVRKVLEQKIDAEWGRIAHRWVKQMIQKGWLRLDVRGSSAVLTAYPGTSHSFTRQVDLARHGTPRSYATNKDVYLDPEFACLTLDGDRPEDERVLVSLPEILWLPQ